MLEFSYSNGTNGQVNYWDDVLNRVCTRYLDSSFVGHSRSNDLLEHFLLGLQSLDKAKLIQVSMDGPNVNWAFFEELRNTQDENDMNKLLPTASCGLHSIHLAFKTGENYIEITGSEQFPLPFRGTRWIEDQKVALRAIEI